MGQRGLFHIVLQAPSPHTSHQHLESHLQPVDKYEHLLGSYYGQALGMQSLIYQRQIPGGRLSLEGLRDTPTLHHHPDPLRTKCPLVLFSPVLQVSHAPQNAFSSPWLSPSHEISTLSIYKIQPYISFHLRFAHPSPSTFNVLFGLLFLHYSH